MLLPIVLFLAAIPGTAPAANEGRVVSDADNAQLEFHGAALFNNVWNKGDIRDARQAIFTEAGTGGWTWDWPEKAGPAIKTYPEIVAGRSPWSPLRAGDRLPLPLRDLRLALDFDFAVEAAGSWCTSFDFWIASASEPTPQNLTCNVNIWVRRQVLTPPYSGKHETITLGGRTYEAIIETLADNSQKAWNTLCLVDSEPRSAGSLDLGELAAFLVARGLARPADFLVTAELGNEVAWGRGRMTIRKFELR
jgi:hypothetical protein